MNTQIDIMLWKGRLDERLHDAWNYLLTVDPHATVFHHPQWFLLACQTGVTHPWGVVLIRVGGQPVGLFPLRRYNPWRWEILRPCAQYEPQWLIDPQYEQAAWDGLLTWFHQLPGIALLALGISDHEERFTRLEAASERQRLFARRKQRRLPVTWSQLPESWEAFLTAIPASTKKELLRAEKRLRRDYPDEVVIEYLSDLASGAEAIEELIRLNRCRWGAQLGGCFLDDPKQRTFFQQVLVWALQQGMATMSRLRVQGKTVVVSALFHLPGRDVLYEHFVARDCAVLPNYYSPGIVECNATMQWAIQRGFHIVNQGTGNSQYKLKYLGVERPRWTVLVTRSRLALQVLPLVEKALYLLSRIPAHLGFYLGCCLQTIRRKTAISQRQ
jgi:CelD/BcsL family acetyltransferase involved in cellulose biosynthesis